jgi:UDP-N-acetylmuramate--alanine ligase
VLNAAGALALCNDIVNTEFGEGAFEKRLPAVAEALEGFRGSKRRSEIVASLGGVIFMDDYAHHPTAIKATLEGLREFYPTRRIVVSFMSHTYSRTAALLERFSSCWGAADVVFFHKIYSSAREKPEDFPGITGRVLYEKARLTRPGNESSLHYVDEPLDAVPEIAALLAPGDLFITMGAGDNFKLLEPLLAAYGKFVRPAA